MDEADALTDDDFPSGEWTGFYLQDGRKSRQDLVLTFRDGRLTGTGSDPVGHFTVDGQYDPDSREIWWTKTYPGSHDVFYRGFREIRGIWGTWAIGWHTGGFHIWPRALGEELDDSKVVERELPSLVGPPR